MAALLPAQRKLAGAQLLKDVPVADLRLDEPDPGVGHRELQPEVAHDGRHEGLVGEHALLAHRERQERHDVVAVDVLAGRGHREAPVRVAVVRDTQVGAVLHHRRAQALQVRGAAVVVDVQAVGRRVDRDHIRARLLVRLGRDLRRRAVRAVHDDAQPLQPVRGRGDQVVDVVLGTVDEVVHPADPRAGRALPVRPGPGDLRLDLVLDLVGELVPTGGEELDAVVRHGVVRGRQHHAQVGAGLPGQVRHPGRGQDVDAQHVRAGAGEAGHDRRLQHLAAGPRVPADDSQRRVRAVPFGEHMGRRLRDGHRQFGREIGVGQAADAVGAEKPAHGTPP